MEPTLPPSALNSQPIERKGGCRNYLGCGCMSFLIASLLFLGLLAGTFFYLKKNMEAILATEPVPIASHDGGDADYAKVLAKLDQLGKAMDQSAENSVSFSADEINTFLAHDPLLSAAKNGIFIQIENNQIHAQFSVSAQSVHLPFYADHFFNGEVVIYPSVEAHTLHVNFSKLTLNHEEISSLYVAQVSRNFNIALESAMKTNPDTKNVLEHLKSVHVENNELVVEVE